MASAGKPVHKEDKRSELSMLSMDSVKVHFLDYQGILKKRKATQIVICNDSNYDLIVIVETDPMATKMVDGTKITPGQKTIPTIETVPAKTEAKLDVRTKFSYLTILRKVKDRSGYLLVRSKRPLERSSKWTATNKMIERCQMHCAESFMNQFLAGDYADKDEIATNPTHHVASQSSSSGTHSKDLGAVGESITIYAGQQ